ncbi:hypothetical protein VPH35_056498 [Triticum aestivum]|uniref:peroxidase n=1 Tax=Triticum aestivum TaxID=4565 RepID=A0A077RZS9_WHEAT|nr:unnamed protein product [Triticum aestivum]
MFDKLGLKAPDLGALSGGHTIGDGHCSSFEKRLYPHPDPSMSPSFIARLKQTCPAKGTVARTALDVGTPKVFDNQYYVNLLHREGLFVSDQDLFTNDITRPIVKGFARSQRDFFNQDSQDGPDQGSHRWPGPDPLQLRLPQPRADRRRCRRGELWLLESSGVVAVNHVCRNKS